MITAGESYMLRPSVQHSHERRKQLMKEIEQSIIQAAQNDEYSVQIKVKDIDKNYIVDTLREHGYECSVEWERSNESSWYYGIKIWWFYE